MDIINQEIIKRNLHAFDLQQKDSLSAQFTHNLKTKNLPKNHSFREISDWNESQHIEHSFQVHQHPENAKKHNFSPGFRDFSFFISPKKSSYLPYKYSPTRKVERCYLSPIKMQFAISRSKKKLSNLPKLTNNVSTEKTKQSAHEQNFEPLNKLYKIKTKSTSKRQGSNSQQYQVAFPHKNSQVKFPTTERISSVLRMMKRNHQIQQIKRKTNAQHPKQHIFMIPD